MVPIDRRLSVVVASRNDDHGENMLRRFRLFADGLLEQAERHRLSGELIVVEWNPPPGPRLSDVLRLRTKSARFPIRYIEVPPHVHRRVRNAESLPLFQMIAKNVGIRRARGEYVLATNPDLLFTDPVIALLASDRLATDAMYRIDRHDVGADVPDDLSFDEQIAWCGGHVLRVHTGRGSLPPGVTDLVDFALRRSSGWRESLSRLRGALRALSRLRPSRESLRVALQHAAKLLDAAPAVHTNACGDFTLLARERWHALDGYPELPLWSMHLDSLLCYMAVAEGARQEMLRSPARAYHVEHGRSWVSHDSAARLATFARTPWLDVGLLYELWHQMLREHRAIRLNDARWGLGDLALRETVVAGGESFSSAGEAPCAPGAAR